MADLVERLRAWPSLPAYQPNGYSDALHLKAADRIEQLEREKAVVSDLWEQQKEIALGYLADCNKAADRIEALAAKDALIAELGTSLQATAEAAATHLKTAMDRQDIITALEAEIARKDEALCFYADPEAYCQLYIPGAAISDPRTFAPVLQDDGARARKALAALGTKS